MTNYALEFVESAMKEWVSLDNSIRVVFRKKLAKRLEEPHVDKDKCHGLLSDCYKIKHRNFRLIYRIEETELVVLVISANKREGGLAYKVATNRILKIKNPPDGGFFKWDGGDGGN